MKYAEDFNYWDTTINPIASLGEIQAMLDEFGATATMATQGQTHGNYAWMIRFQWHDKAYRFLFTPLPCRWPDKVSSFHQKRRKHSEQARYQMGRIAQWFVKAILTAAEAQPAALFGFLELPGARPGSIPPVASELDVEELASGQSLIDIPQLESGD